MKKIITAIFACIALASCTPPIKQMTTQCDVPPEDLLRSATTLVMQEGMTIKQVDAKLGFMQAEANPEREFFSGVIMTKVWVFQINGNKLIAMAKVTAYNQNTFGATVGMSEVYYDDAAHEDHPWYWNVRNGLEKLCGNKVVFIEKKK